jgi:hypothetical protein
LQLWMWLGTCGRVPEGSLTTAYALSFSEPKSSSLRSLSLFASIPGKPKDSSMFKKKPREWVQAFTKHIKLRLQQLTNTWRLQTTQL